MRCGLVCDMRLQMAVTYQLLYVSKRGSRFHVVSDPIWWRRFIVS